MNHVLFDFALSMYRRSVKTWKSCCKKDRLWKRQTRGTSIANEWQRVVQRMATSDNEWYSKWQRMTASDNEWQPMTKSNKK